jgi:hypothetical protein
MSEPGKAVGKLLCLLIIEAKATPIHPNPIVKPGLPLLD